MTREDALRLLGLPSEAGADAAVPSPLRTTPPPGLSETQLHDLPATGRLATTGASPAAGHTLQPGQVLAGRYEVRRERGRGGMGVVYAAFDRLRQQEVALKVLLPHLLLDPQARERFTAEA